MSTKDKALCVLAGLAVIILILYGSIAQNFSQNAAPAAGSGFTLSVHDNNGDTGATTTPQFLATGATTTITEYTALADMVSQNLYLNASSSSSCLQWYNQFSNNDVDWYYQDGNTVTSNVLVTHGPQPSLNVWCPAAAGASLRDVSVLSTGSKYMRTIYAVTGAAGSLYVQYVLKNEIQN